jgi:hypothetical protein
MQYVFKLPIYHFSPNGLVFVSKTYSCFVLSRVENYFVITARKKFVLENMGI